MCREKFEQDLFRTRIEMQRLETLLQKELDERRSLEDHLAAERNSREAIEVSIDACCYTYESHGF